MKTNDAPLQLVGFSAFLLFAYTWTTPLRDIYGLDVRNALMAREMLENGISFIPRAMGQLYPDYPPLHFWLEVLFSMPLGHINTLSVVIPSALSAIGLVALTFRLGCEINRRVGWLAALILATSPGFWIEAGNATIDMLLALNVSAAIACLYFRDKTGASTIRQMYTFGVVIFLALAFLSKGPIGIVLPAAAWGGYLLMERRLKDLLLFGLFTCLIGAAYAVGEMAIAWREGGTGFVHEVINMQVIGRVGHEANSPVYYYLVRLPGEVGPWFFWCIPALARFFGRLRGGARISGFRESMPTHPVSKLAFIWFLGVFTLFTVASTRHGRYILPLFPALAIMLATSVNRVLDEGGPSHTRLWDFILSGLTLMIAIAGVGFVVFFHQKCTSAAVPMFTALWTGAVFAGWFAIRKMRRRELCIVASMVLLLITGLSGFNLLAQPIISKKASGRSFVETSENQVNDNYPVAIYGLGRDGDGVKYALYSSRSPEALIFISQIEEIRKLPRPCLFVVYEKDMAMLQPMLQTEKFHPLTKGSIRSKAVAAYILGPPEADDGGIVKQCR